MGLNLINMGKHRNQLLYSAYINECLGYIKREVLDQVNNCHPLKYDSMPLSCNQCPDFVFWIMSPRLCIHGHGIYTEVTQGCEKIWLYFRATLNGKLEQNKQIM